MTSYPNFGMTSNQIKDSISMCIRNLRRVQKAMNDEIIPLERYAESTLIGHAKRPVKFSIRRQL